MRKSRDEGLSWTDHKDGISWGTCVSMEPWWTRGDQSKIHTKIKTGSLSIRQKLKDKEMGSQIQIPIIVYFIPDHPDHSIPRHTYTIRQTPLQLFFRTYNITMQALLHQSANYQPPSDKQQTKNNSDIPVLLTSSPYSVLPSPSS